MIELVLADRCTGCGDCVAACPTNVFDQSPGGVPAIARQAECQTCFLCELHCRADALFVASESRHPVPVDRAAVLADGTLGRMRRDSGWDEWSGDPRYANLHWRMGEFFSRALDPAAKR